MYISWSILVIPSSLIWESVFDHDAVKETRDEKPLQLDDNNIIPVDTLHSPGTSSISPPLLLRDLLAANLFGWHVLAAVLHDLSRNTLRKDRLTADSV